MDRTEKIAAILGITEAIKQYGIPSKFCPTLAIIVGALLEYAENPTSEGIIQGVVLGATVTGGYKVVKSSGTAVLNSDSKKKESALAYEHEDYRGV